MGLPRVTVYDIVSRGRDGELLGVPVSSPSSSSSTTTTKSSPSPKVEIVTPRGRSAAGVGDRVLARLVGRSRAKVIKRLSVTSRRILGVLTEDRESGGKELVYRVDPTDRSSRPIFVAPDNIGDAELGDLVEVSIDSGVGRVDSVYGHANSPESYWVIAATEHEIPRIFDDAVLDESSSSSSLDITKDRTDWRDFEFVTIDPSDAPIQRLLV